MTTIASNGRRPQQEPAPHTSAPAGCRPAGTLHLIGNAHLDPVWLWRWQEGFQAARATFRSALDRMRETPDFVFTSSSAAIYEWVEQSDPAMFAEIQARVAEGRWQIVGGWWIQPDCNLPCGESFVRQALYGQRYFRQKLGVTATVGYNVDSFGHHAMLPQLLRRSGIDHYVFMRPDPGEKGLPGPLFWWESDDGSRVLAFRIPYEYATWGGDLERHLRRCAAELRPPLGQLMCFYGVGNHGGGPTRENLASIARLQDDPTLPALRFSTPEAFFQAVLADNPPLPTVHDELQHHASGCYAAHAGVKRWNRQAEQQLLAAEKLASVAAQVVGAPYPDLGRAWQNVLFNQFHDILAGTSLEAAYDDARDSYGEALAIAGRALNYAAQALAAQIAIPPDPADPESQPVVVFNPHPWPVAADVEVELSHPPADAALVDEAGVALLFQETAPHAVVSGWRRRLAFLAELPPLGYRVYRVAVSPAASPVAGHAAARGQGTTIENAYLRLTIDPATGFVASLYDKRHGVDVLLGPAARPVVVDDPSDAWGHGVYQFHDLEGTFEATSVLLVEDGPVRAAVRVASAYGASRLTQEFRLCAGAEVVEVAVTLDWRERRRALKLRFPVNLNFPRATYEIPYGTVERPCNGEEEPGQGWVDLSGVARGADVPYGLSLLNDGKYSFDVRGRELGMMVARSPIYAHHHPTEPAPGEQHRHMDQGEQRFCYALLPHAGGWREGGTARRAAELNQRPIVQFESCHAGGLPQRAMHLACEPASVLLGALKRAEDGGATIVRCYETAGAAVEATIAMPAWGRTITLALGPCAIKTLRVPDDPLLPVAEVNLIEW